jgi:hypothetical protein
MPGKGEVLMTCTSFKLPPSAADWAHAAGISRADTAQAVKVLAKGMGFMKWSQ